MSASNYARRVGKRGEVLDVRFFTLRDEVPRELLALPWVWWAVPREYREVTLIGEGRGERCVRLQHGPRECELCDVRKQRSA